MVQARAMSVPYPRVNAISVRLIAGVLGYLFVVVLAALSIYVQRPPAPVAATAPQTDFSSARAMELLKVIAAKPHPVGSIEHTRVRDRYGRNAWGQRCLLARRLVEAGVDLVSVALNGPLCGRVQNWDDHAVNHHVFDGMKYRAPFFDQAGAALIEREPCPMDMVISGAGACG